MQFDLDKSVRYGLAYSGGVDSCYLLAELLRQGYDVKAYTILDDLQITRDTDDSVTIAKMLGAEQEIIPINIWDGHDDLRANPWDRCYHCKSMVFGTILEHMRADGRTVLLDGTNASDDAGDRPGMRALRELAVRSPLRECGLTKRDVRMLSRDAGLFTWDKPAYACLATRIPTGQPITARDLAVTEAAESDLFSLGFTDFRVRMVGRSAKIQLPAAQMPGLLEHRQEILQRLGPDYDGVWLDLEGRE